MYQVLEYQTKETKTISKIKRSTDNLILQVGQPFTDNVGNKQILKSIKKTKFGITLFFWGNPQNLWANFLPEVNKYILK